MQVYILLSKYPSMQEHAGGLLFLFSFWEQATQYELLYLQVWHLGWHYSIINYKIYINIFKIRIYIKCKELKNKNYFASLDTRVILR
jgi:hypothetical protein